MNATNPIETLASAMAHAAYEAFPLFEYEDRDWEEYRKTKADVRIKKTRKHGMYDLTVYSMFTQMWGSTALGFGGIGGAAMTSAYVCVIESNLLAQYAVYFGGRLAYVIKKPNEKFFSDIADQRMVDAKLGEGTYEQ
jgi:hypothetical protein